MKEGTLGNPTNASYFFFCGKIGEKSIKKGREITHID